MPQVIEAPARRSGTRTPPAHRQFPDEYVQEVGQALLNMQPGQVLKLDEYVTGHRVPVSGKGKGVRKPGANVASSTAQALRAVLEERYKKLNRRVKTSVLDPENPEADDAQWFPLLGVYAEPRKERAPKDAPAS